VKTPLRKRELADRESLRWVETAEAAQDVLAEAAMVTVVSDPGGRHLRQLGAASRGPLARAEPGDERGLARTVPLRLAGVREIDAPRGSNRCTGRC